MYKAELLALSGSSDTMKFSLTQDDNAAVLMLNDRDVSYLLYGRVRRLNAARFADIARHRLDKDGDGAIDVMERPYFSPQKA